MLLGRAGREARPSSRQDIQWIHEERDLKTVQLYFLPEERLDHLELARRPTGKRTYAYSARGTIPCRS